MAISFTLNGKSQSVEVDPQMPLLWVLRDTLNMTGTKLAADGVVRSVTVHIKRRSGAFVHHANFAVAGKKITTTKSLADGNHPVQQAWVELRSAMRLLPVRTDHVSGALLSKKATQ